MPPGSTATLAAIVRGALALSHQKAKDLVGSGRVLLDGTPEFDPARRPRPGSLVTFAAVGTPRVKRPLVGPGFRVVHLDETIVVVEKDAGVVVVPTTKESPSDPPLVARVLAALAQAGNPVRRGLYVVHRIDRSTSGLVLFARSAEASNGLRAQFRARRPLREYLAWTEGIPEPPAGVMRHHLRESERTRRVFATRKTEGAREAELSYEVEASAEEPRRARVRVRLVTGRRNQIRVQFANCGWPLLGDHFYGARDEGPGRTALHAARLGFTHPATGEALLFECPLPPDLERAVTEAYDRLAEGSHDPLDVAVRSSATPEDLPDASFAGQQETYPSRSP